MTLTPEQQSAVDGAAASLKGKKPLYRIGGYAGTGKTTIAKWIVEHESGAMVCAFTGKAACRLREKGLHAAATIHSIIYCYDPGMEKFVLKSEVQGKYFLIDEGSMISCQLWEDVKSFGLPIIVLGDPGQLEPIGRDPNLIKDPDVVLEHIHRQAEGSGILTFAEDIRLKKPYRHYGDEVDIHYDDKPKKADVFWADIIICGMNRTRHRINKYYRELHDHPEGEKKILYKNEQIICLRNNRDLGVFNGQIFTIDEVLSIDGHTIEVRVKDNGTSRELKLTDVAFGKKLPADCRNLQHRVIADYGYCITCHKSQGSEWDKVVVIDQQCSKWDAARWRYTAITRSVKELRYFFV